MGDSNSMWKPNILYIAIDSLRTDALQHTDTLQFLARENVWFENAITPATWSLPAYTSLLSGKYPHSHGVTQPGDIPDQLDVVETLSERGYSTYGVSGNPFLSPSQGFDRPFDRFWLTPRMWFSEEMDVSNHEEALRKAARGSFRERMAGLSRFGYEFLKHPHRIKSVGNIAFFITHRLDLDEFLDTTVPHPLFDKPAYWPKTNTSIVSRLLKQEAGDPTPFFIFTQYNDPHHPNWPTKEFSEEIGYEGGEREICEINNRTATFEYLSNDVPSEILQKRRELYKRDVMPMDEHIKKLIRRLDELGLQNNTIVIITADHGENLGGLDRRGRRRMGHFASMSNELVNVPLILAYPGNEANTIQEAVSTKDVGSTIVDGSLFGDDHTIDLDSLRPEDGVVLCEAPAKGGKNTVSKSRPDAPTEAITEEASENSVLGKFHERDAIASSTGERWAWDKNESVEYSSVPSILLERVNEALEQLNTEYEERELTESVTRNLEEMGYL